MVGRIMEIMSMLSRSGVPALIGFLALILVLGGVVQQSPILALDQQAGKGVGQPVEVPFRLTISKHLMVRARINGKGPFNFVLDTGAPALFFTEKVAERAGVAQQKDGWGVCDTFELEGGLQIPKAKVRIDTPFQLEGMNGMGLAGAEIHGLMGYNILAQYRITIDLAGDRMVWRRLDWEPKSPFGIVDKSDSSGQGGLEIIGGLMKGLGGVLGRKANPNLVSRGYAGVLLAQPSGEKLVKVEAVLPGSPAEKAGLKAGDHLVAVDGEPTTDAASFFAAISKAKKGQELRLKVDRAGAGQEIVLLLEGGI